jgi:pyruvate/2-oxoacid:ferredoxin oxidoreductase beta subunit
MNKTTSYLSVPTKALPFCPGCGHIALVKALDKALVQRQPDPRQVVIVTDIGCIGLVCRYFTTNAFHGLHGRAITYASGLKLARPELTVIALMGDGGCGIGGTHVLNVARRNIGITLIVANNFNYGMTGGQHSVTTPKAGITATTPWGNPEAPLDLCATVAAAGGAWIARATAFDKGLADSMLNAIQQSGFSMLEVVESCAAYYARRNPLRKRDLLELMQQTGLAQGLIVDKPRTEYSAHVQSLWKQHRDAPPTALPIDMRFAHTLDRTIRIVIAGSAGQRIRTAATSYARAAISAGLYATQKDDYQITVRTGHSVSELTISPNPIVFTAIEQPDYLLLVSQPGVDRIQAQIAASPPEATIYLDQGLQLPDTNAKKVALPLLNQANKANQLAAASRVLARLLQDTGWFPEQALTAE